MELKLDLGRLGLTFLVYFASMQLVNGSTVDNRMSMDTKPVRFTVNGSMYSVPRNFLYEMSDWSGGEQRNGVSIRIAYPGLKPYSRETERCMLRKRICRLYNIYITAEKFSSEETSQALINNPAILKTERSGPYGFSNYEIGPPSARINLYQTVSKGRALIFDCESYNMGGKRGAICHHFAHAKSGGTISYYFSEDMGLKDAVEVDEEITDLINGFELKVSK